MGSVLVVKLTGSAEGKNYGVALIVMTGFAVLGLIAALLLPAQAAPSAAGADIGQEAAA